MVKDYLWCVPLWEARAALFLNQKDEDPSCVFDFFRKEQVILGPEGLKLGRSFKGNNL